MKFQYLEPAHWGKWDDFVRSSQQGTIFQTSKYLNIYSTTFKRKIRIGTVVRGEEIVGGLVLIPNRYYGISYLSLPYLIPYNGILTNDFSQTSFYYKKINQQNKIVAIILDAIEKNWKICSIHQHQKTADLRLFYLRSWQFEPNYSITIALDAVTKKPAEFIAKDQRRRIRRIESTKVELILINDINELYQMVFSSYKSHYLKLPISKENFFNYTKMLLDTKIAKCFALKFGQNLLSSILIIEDFPKAYAIFSGRSVSEVSSSSEIYLIWKVMQVYAQKNFLVFDLLGAMVSSIAKIKLELGGELVRSDKIVFYQNKFYKVLFNFMVCFTQRARRMKQSG